MQLRNCPVSNLGPLFHVHIYTHNVVMAFVQQNNNLRLAQCTNPRTTDQSRTKVFIGKCNWLYQFSFQNIN